MRCVKGRETTEIDGREGGKKEREIEGKREKAREKGSVRSTSTGFSVGVGVAFLSDTQLEHFSPLFPITENDHQSPAPHPAPSPRSSQNMNSISVHIVLKNE